MKSNIRKFAAVVATCMLSVSLSACQAPKEFVMVSYTSADGKCSVTLPEGLAQTDSIKSIMLLDGSANNLDLVAVTYGISRSEIAGGGSDIDTLEKFEEQFELLGKISPDWKNTSDRQREGLEHCVLKEGTVIMNGVSSDAVMLLGEDASGYCAAVVLGEKRTLDNLKEKITIVRHAGNEKISTVDFIDGLQAVMVSLSGNTMQASYAAYQVYDKADETGKKDLQASYDQMQKTTQQTLSDSWDITDTVSLLKEQDAFKKNAYNQAALALLTEYGVDETVSREELEAKMVSDGLSKKETIYVLAAYDARAAFGDNAIKAWDLSQIPTIMGLGYAAGYVTYDFAMDASLEAAKMAQESFDSWDAFNQSYLYGYAYMSEESLDDPDSSAYARQELVKTLEAEENGPFSVDWNLELKKEW